MTGPDSSYNCPDAYDLACLFENSLRLQISPVLQMAELFVDFLWKKDEDEFCMGSGRGETWFLSSEV